MEQRVRENPLVKSAIELFQGRIVHDDEDYMRARRLDLTNKKGRKAWVIFHKTKTGWTIRELSGNLSSYRDQLETNSQELIKSQGWQAKWSRCK